MATDNGTNQASACGTAAAAEGRGLKALMVGSSIVLWAFALYGITALNSLRADMKELQETVGSVLSITSNQNIDAMEVVGQDGEVVYTLKRPPPPPAGACGMGGMGACGMPGDGCGGGTGKLGAVGSAAGSAAGSCPAHAGGAAPAEKQ
jgi:hypothetical protein